MIYLLCRL